MPNSVKKPWHWVSLSLHLRLFWLWSLWHLLYMYCNQSFTMGCDSWPHLTFLRCHQSHQENGFDRCEKPCDVIPYLMWFWNVFKKSFLCMFVQNKIECLSVCLCLTAQIVCLGIRCLMFLSSNESLFLWNSDLLMTLRLSQHYRPVRSQVIKKREKDYHNFNCYRNPSFTS